jgi:hypothetical protein
LPKRRSSAAFASSRSTPTTRNFDD